MAVSNAEKAKKSRTSKAVINKNAQVTNIKTDPAGTKYRCTVCGKFYGGQKSNFFVSRSMLYEGNNGYVTVCKSCAEKYYRYLVEYFSGNEEKALDKICSTFDLYYSDEIAASAGRASDNLSRLSAYIRQSNLIQNKEKGTTYLDTLRDRETETIDSLDDLDEAKENGERVSKKAVERWGLGFSAEEYIQLDNHYKTLKTQISDDDPMQEIYIKDMCNTKVMQLRALKAGDVDTYDKLQKSYQSTAKAANLKPIEKAVTDLENPEETFGCFVGKMENFTPASLYSRPKLFEDVDSLGEYYKRFVARPFKNFFSGSREQDPEYSVSLGDEDGG